MQEFQASLSPVEQKLCTRLELMKVVGKMCKAVPILLTPDVIDSMNVLVQSRSAVGIPDANPYFFAHVYGKSLGHIETWDCLHKDSHDRIQSTKLRKYVATVSQVFSLQSEEIDWLSRHLGHDIRTHRRYHRLHESIFELAKISKLVTAVDTCDPQTWKGKSLDAIDLSSDIVLDSHDPEVPGSTDDR